MIGPEKLQSIPDEMAQIMRALQDWGIEDIARRIANAGIVASSAEYTLTTMMEQDVFQTEWGKRIAEAAGMTDETVEFLLREASEANYIYDKRAFEAAGIPFTPFEENVFVQDLTRNIIAQTQGEFKNITRSMGFARKVNGRIVFEPLAKFYQTELNLATTKVAAGLQTFDGAVKEAVTRMADSGLRTVSYQSGHVDRIDVAARRATLAAMKELTVRQSDYNSEIMGTTTFEFSWHSGHRPSHGWGGRRYDRLGAHYPKREDVYEKYGGGGLDDYNCYHEEYAIFPDSPPKYTDEQLDQMSEKEQQLIEFEGNKYNAYDARQQQRALERIMRRQKSKIAGYEGARGRAQEELQRVNELPEAAPKALQKAMQDNAEVSEMLQQAKVANNQTRKQYKDFSAAMGLPTEFERVHTGYIA